MISWIVGECYATSTFEGVLKVYVIDRKVQYIIFPACYTEISHIYSQNYKTECSFFNIKAIFWLLLSSFVCHVAAGHNLQRNIESYLSTANRLDLLSQKYHSAQPEWHSQTIAHKNDELILKILQRMPFLSPFVQRNHSHFRSLWSVCWSC